MSFTIQCATCRSRLRVQDETVVGQIVSCPKCSSMVLIERPPGVEPAAKENVRSTEPETVEPVRQSSAPGKHDSQPLEAPRAEEGKSASQSDTPSSSGYPGMSGLLEEDMDELLAGQPRREPDPDAETVADPLLSEHLPIAKSTDHSPKESDQEDEQYAADSSAPPPGEWLSDESRQLRRWGFIGGMGVAAVITIIILIGFALTRKSTDSGRLVQSDPRTGVANAGSADETAAVDPAAAETESNRSAEDTESLVDESPRESEREVADHAAPDSTREASEDSDARFPDGAGEENHHVGSTADAPLVPTPDDTAMATDGNGEAVVDGNESVGSGSSALRLFPGLRDFDDLLSEQPLDSSLVLADSPFDLIPVPGIPYDLGLAMPKPTPRQVNVTSQLGVRIPEIEFTEMPLLSFIRFLSEFTTIPITLDIDALNRMNLSPEAPVRLKTSNSEVGEILRLGIEPFRLSFQIIDSQLIIREMDGEKLREQMYEVADLTGDRPEAAAALESLITAMVAPETWQSRGGEGKLSVREGRLEVHQISAVQSQVRDFCRHLRLARGLPPQGDWAGSDNELELRLASALPKLEQPVSVQSAIPTPLVKILDQLSADTAMIFVVDWQSLITVGWNPDTLARLEAEDESLSSVLRELLGPMQLSFRVIDERTLQITTASVTFETLEVGFFPLGDLMDQDAGQQILDGVREALGDVLSLERRGGGTRFDNPSRTLVVRAAQHQLAAVARKLEQLRLQVR